MQCFQNEINYPENADKKEASSQMNSCTRINHMLIYSLTSDTFVEADFFFFYQMWEIQIPYSMERLSLY